MNRNRQGNNKEGKRERGKRQISYQTTHSTYCLLLTPSTAVEPSHTSAHQYLSRTHTHTHTTHTHTQRDQGCHGAKLTANKLTLEEFEVLNGEGACLAIQLANEEVWGLTSLDQDYVIYESENTHTHTHQKHLFTWNCQWFLLSTPMSLVSLVPIDHHMQTTYN